MKKTLVLAVVSALVSLLSPLPTHAADTQQQFQALLSQVTAKMQTASASGTKVTEADLADEFKGIDNLLAESKGEKTDAAAMILKTKGDIYAMVLHDDEKALAVYQQVKTDYPDTSLGHQMDRVIASATVQSKLKVGAPFPDFQETDLDGKSLSPSNYKGKVVLIDFWATWCGPCVGELPNVKKVYSAYHDQGFEIIGVSLDKEKATLTSFLQKNEIPWPQYFDGKMWQNKIARVYGIDGVPATYLLDKDGKIIAKGLRGEELEAAVKKALGSS